MAKRERELFPWERHCGCPTCKARPRERCRTLRSRYPEGWTFRGGIPAVGQPTSAHKARYALWNYLFRANGI